MVVAATMIEPNLKKRTQHPTPILDMRDICETQKDFPLPLVAGICFEAMIGR